MEWFFDPVFKGRYPDFLVEWFRAKGAEVPIEEGDLETISQPIDLLGINYYTGNVGRYKAGAGMFDCEDVDMGYEKTDIGWFIYPDGFRNVLTYIHWQKDTANGLASSMWIIAPCKERRRIVIIGINN